MTQIDQAVDIREGEELDEPVILHFGNAYLHAAATRRGLEHAIVPAHGLYKSAATLPLFCLRFAWFLRQSDIGVLHSHLFGAVTASALATRLCGARHIGTLHDVYTVQERPSLIGLLRLSALLGTQLVAVSRQMERYYRSLAPFGGGRLVTITNGVELPPAGGRDEARQRLGIEPDQFVLCCVARLVPLKRHDVLLDALSRVPAAQSARITTLLVGDGPERDALTRRASSELPASRIRIVGQTDDVPTHLAAADAFVLCSETEGLSRSILEAMAAGLPCLVTDVGGNGELVTDGRTGRLLPVGDAGALARAVVVLIEDPALRSEQGEAAREWIRERYSRDAYLAAYFELYGIEAA